MIDRPSRWSTISPACDSSFRWNDIVAAGMIVMAMIYAVGDVSGAHLNPAVTLGFWVARRFDARQIAPYIGSQLAGAFAASVCLKLMFPGHTTLGATIPAGPPWQSFALEF